MSINLVVAITDADWFQFLRLRGNLTEVNFWSPSPRNFKALQSGELFLFKLHAPNNFIVGGGVFAHSNVMPCSLAWEAFGESNGAASEAEMRERIAKYRREPIANQENFQIGCRILTQPFFFAKQDWIPVPGDWSPNIVSFKTYNAEEAVGFALWEAVQERLQMQETTGLQDEAARFGAPQLLHPRLGQGAFRVLVTDAYQRRCAITRERTLPALEAAHIRPYSEGGLHSTKNGMLLRRDIHSLFDSGYVTVTPNLHFEVSSRIREEFENGRHYYALHGQKISEPDKQYPRPDLDALQWHNEYRFKG